MRLATLTVSPKRQYLGIVTPTTPATTKPLCDTGGAVCDVIITRRTVQGRGVDWLIRGEVCGVCQRDSIAAL